MGEARSASSSSRSPQTAMETAGGQDYESLVRVMTEYYGSAL